jgi:hypothetical protein
MCATAANLIERVLPQTGLRQWVLRFPFSWRRRLAQDGALLGRLTRIFEETVQTFYAARAAKDGIRGAKTGSVTVVQRTSSDLRLNPHLHLVTLDGAYHEQGAELAWQALGHLKTSEVGVVLERTVRRIEKQLRRRGLLVEDDGADAEGDADPESNLAASAVSGQAPPAGPQWMRGLQPLEPHALAYDKPLCASLDGFTLHAATRAGAIDQAGREALLRYVLRPPIAQERVDLRPDGLLRITLKKAYADGTVAVDMDPLSLLCRLATSVPPPRFHTVRYAGVLASASPWRSRIAPKPPKEAAAATGEPQTPKRASGYRPWAELLARAFGVDPPRLSQVPGAHETPRDGQRPREHRPLPRSRGRGDRGPAPLREPRPAVLEESRPSPAGARRRGRMSQRGRRGAIGAWRERGAAAAWTGARARPDRRHGALPRRSMDAPRRLSGCEAALIGLARPCGSLVRNTRDDAP